MRLAITDRYQQRGTLLPRLSRSLSIGLFTTLMLNLTDTYALPSRTRKVASAIRVQDDG